LSIDHPDASRQLPDRPNLRHLKDQAKDLLKTGRSSHDQRCAVQDRASLRLCELAEAQGSHRLLEEIGQLKQAIDTNDIDRVKTLMTRNPVAAQCSTGLRQRRAAHVGGRMPRPKGITESGEAGHGGMDARTRVGRAPGGRRTADASRAQGDRIPMMELLVSHGADVNALWHGHFPIIFAPASHWIPRAQMAPRSRRQSELSRPWLRDERPSLSRHGSRLRHRVVRP
jgi:hypothetical protein